MEAFDSIEHIMRDVNNGWLIRYLHSNTASAFFFLVYLHIGRGLYYGSYKAPRTLTWVIGTIILITMIATAFLGYVLPYGQMSLWGIIYLTFMLFSLFIYKLYNIYIMNKLFIRVLSIKCSHNFIKPDNKFMSMFVGFMDRDGYFDLENKNNIIIIKILL